MANLCNRCERIFNTAVVAFAFPGVVERYCWEFGSYQALQQNAESRRCQLCCILFSLRRQDAIDQLLQNLHQDQLDFAFELGYGDSNLLFLVVFHSDQADARLFSSRVWVRKSARQWLSVRQSLSS